LLMVLMSLFAGLAAGALIAYLLKYVREEVVLFVLTMSLAVVFISQYFELHFILICLIAGFLVENFSGLGERLVGAIERTSMAVYIVFFAIAGASIDFAALKQMWPCALLFVVLRLAGTGVGTMFGGRIGNESSIFKRYGWMGFVSQAGVSLGLVTLVARAFPDWGQTFRTIMIAAIAINQILGPVTLKILLGQAGETAEQHMVSLIRRPFLKKTPKSISFDT